MGAEGGPGPHIPRQRQPQGAPQQPQSQPAEKPKIWTRGLLWLVLAALAIGVIANILS